MVDISEEKMEWFKEAQLVAEYWDNYDNRQKTHVHIREISDLPEIWDGIESVFLVGSDSELIKKLPDILKEAKNLKELSISRYYFDWNDLTTLDLKKLESLNIQIKQVYYAPRLCLPNLKSLILSYPEDKIIKSTSEVYEEHMDYSGLRGLNRLDLRNMADISPDDFSELDMLEYLRLTHNYGANLEWLKNAKYRLKTLIIDHGVEDCSGINYQECIENLELFYHEIKDISPIERLQNLKKLNLGRNLLEAEGNLRNMGIERLQITKRDYDTLRIYDEVKKIVQIAVKEDRNRKQYYEENKDKPFFLKKTILKDFLSNSFIERIKILVKEIYQYRIEKFYSKEGKWEINSRYVKVLSEEEYIQYFQQKAIEYYPFLSEL